MANQRIVCIGTGNRLTAPGSVSAENARYYRYPNPGEVHTWEAEATAFELSGLPGHEFVAAYPGGPRIQGYGLLVVGDTYAKVLRPPIESGETIGLGRPDFEQKVFKALERARALAGAWSFAGSLIIAGELPSPEELAQARALRETYARQRLDREMKAQAAARAGRGGAAPYFSNADEAWAIEYGVLLPDTVSMLPKVSVQAVEDTACIYCQNLVNERALKCRHCGEKFGKPLIELLTEPVVIPEAVPEAHRGPGRPRKELAEV